jgi:hypothetical protein
MLSLNDFVNEISVIREVLDNIEIKGKMNRDLVNIAYDKCNKLINEINKAIEEITGNQNGEENTSEQTIEIPMDPVPEEIKETEEVGD